MIENSDVRIFVRVADLGTLSAAAAAIGVPKSTVSRALARLETTLEVALLERSARRVRLTEAGRRFHPQALRVLEEVAEAENCIRNEGRQAVGILRVNAPSSFARHLIAPRLPALLSAHPDLDIVLDVDDDRIDLVAAEADVAIRIGTLSDSELIARRIRETRLLACASPAYIREYGHPQAFSELATHRLVGRWDAAIKSINPPTAGLLPRIRAVSHAPDVVEQLLVAGGGIAWLPDYVADGPIGHGLLTRVLENEPTPSVPVHAVYKVRRHIPASIRVFVDFLTLNICIDGF